MGSSGLEESYMFMRLPLVQKGSMGLEGENATSTGSMGLGENEV